MDYEIYGLLSRGGSRGSRVTVAKSASAVFSCAVMSRECAEGRRVQLRERT